MTLYLSRFSLNRRSPLVGLASLINPSDPNAAADAHHKLVWSLFGNENADQERDFLFRHAGRDHFMALSRRAPVANELIAPLECKEFAPRLKQGQKLGFMLRANATVDRVAERKAGRSRRVDLVMERLHAVGRADRAARRPAVVQEVAQEWLEAQGSRKGFMPAKVGVERYNVVEIKRPRGQVAKLGVMDLTGVLTVTDPDLFLQSLGQGFGRGKAWGCGMMLVRPA